MTKAQPSPNPSKAPRPRWFGHPALLLALFCLIGLDAATMHRHSALHNFFASGRTGPTVIVFASLHGTPDDFRVVWRDQRTPGDDEDHIADVGTAPCFLDVTAGRLHATSIHGSFMPWHSMEGLDERDVALAFHHSAMTSDSETAQHFREHLPQAMASLAQGKLNYREALPIGYARNAIFLGLVATLVFCTVRGRADLWAKRVAIAIGPPTRNPNACPRCEYDCVGLATCPECGAPVDRGPG